jgi:hypothetical protein
MNLIAYNSVRYFDKNFSESYRYISAKRDVKLFGSLFYLYARNMSIVDRTGTITIPIKTTVLPQCKLPEFSKEQLDFEEICDTRARNLMNQAVAENKKIVVMWSGGVDSTLILISFLKTCTQQELKRIVVLLSKHSILENSNFYYEYVLKNFTLELVSKIDSYLHDKTSLLVTGECCDQLFPGWQVLNFSSYYKDISVFDPYTENNIIPYIQKRTELSETDSLKLYGLFDKLMGSCPLEITSLYHYFWWMHFTLKWQNVYTRMLMFVDNLDSINLEENYTSFYIDPKFQQWSINSIDLNVNKLNTVNNLDYKSACKQIIYKFDKNQDYLYNKGKFGSLNKVVARRDVVDGVDEFGKFHKKIEFSEIYQPANSFV